MPYKQGYKKKTSTPKMPKGAATRNPKKVSGTKSKNLKGKSSKLTTRKMMAKKNRGK